MPRKTTKKRRRFTPAQKAEIVRRHMVDKVPIICEGREPITNYSRLLDLARMDDGSMVAVGIAEYVTEDGSAPFGPLVVQFDAETGEVHGSAHGFWSGLALSAAPGPDGSVYVLMRSEPSPTVQYQVRKYGLVGG